MLRRDGRCHRNTYGTYKQLCTMFAGRNNKDAAQTGLLRCVLEIAQLGRCGDLCVPMLNLQQQHAPTPFFWG